MVENRQFEAVCRSKFYVILAAGKHGFLQLGEINVKF